MKYRDKYSELREIQAMILFFEARIEELEEGIKRSNSEIHKRVIRTSLKTAWELLEKYREKEMREIRYNL